MSNPTLPPAPTPAPERRGRGLLIALSIIIGIVLVCAILPLGGLALLFATAGSETTGLQAPRNWQEQTVSGSGLDRVAIIEVNGVIGGAVDAFSTQLSYEEVISQIKQASDDPQVKAVVLRVESPGGGVVASRELHAALEDLRAADKHLVVSMGSIAASGGYYIATPAERIYANADTFTGSLGVILSLTNYQEAFDKVGLRTYVYKSGALKDIGSPTREPTQEEQDVLQSLVDGAYQRFVDVIVDGRGLPRDQVLELADGRIYTGQQALDVGLVDELGDLDEALVGTKELAGLGTDALVVRYQGGDSLLSLLSSRLAAPQQQADPLGLKALTEPRAPLMEYRWLP